MKCRSVMVILAIVLGEMTSCRTGGNSNNDSIEITSIVAGDHELIFTIQGPTTKMMIAELEPFEQYDPTGEVRTIWQGQTGKRVTIPRFTEGRDRLYRKFLLMDNQTQAIGNCRYVTQVTTTTQRQTVLPRPRSPKGLSCIVDIDDAIALGVKHVHENIQLNDIIDWGNPEPQAVWDFEGTAIPLRMETIHELDARLQRFAEAGIGVFVVFTNNLPNEPQPGNPLIHPDSDLINSPTRLGAFPVTSAQGVKHYVAALEFLADRYTRQGAPFGLISSIVIGNELQQHWVWHNMGEAPAERVIAEYERSLRLAWLACQKYHRDLRVYISMDHHWTKRGLTDNPLREIPGDMLLRQMASRSRSQGDFPWHLAFHAYPENLFEPRFWRDRTATDEFSTPRITFKNLQVLTRFMAQDAMRYQNQIRDIALTEQGFHTPDGPDGQAIQAAAYAYAYYKISRMPEISAFILHRHVDHRDEGGLRLGLWSNDPDADTPEEPLKKKMLWEVFHKADTEQWEEAFDFAKTILGIEIWEQKPFMEPPDESALDIES